MCGDGKGSAMFRLLVWSASLSILLLFAGCKDKDNPAGPSVEACKDADGNVYLTVKIGDQVWMAENLKTTRYQNGDSIPNVTGATEWGNLTMGAYCYYDNNSNNAAIYGRLYNCYAVNDSRNITPVGWHVPSDSEWQTLVDYLGGNSIAGGKMKEIGTTHWHSPNTGATDESGFTALPGGYQHTSGGFGSLWDYAVFWSSSDNGSNEAWARGLIYNDIVVDRGSNNKHRGFSIRCIKD